jgi:hypothetical protein
MFSWVRAISLDGFLELSKIMVLIPYSESSDDVNDDDDCNNNTNNNKDFKNSRALYIH